MSVVNATAKSPSANSYITMAEAVSILGTRLYTDKWDTAASTPNAEDYQANGGASAGVSQLAVDSGTGTWTAGTVFTFAGHATQYTVSANLSGTGTLQFSPSLVSAVADNEAVVRVTASTREKAILWATRLLDDMIDWYGYIRTTTQALRWPRSGVANADGLEYDYDTIPALLKVATAELALHMLKTDAFAQPSALGLGVSEVQAGPIKAKIDSTATVPLIPDNILSLLSPLGTLESEAQGGYGILPTLRS